MRAIVIYVLECVLMVELVEQHVLESGTETKRDGHVAKHNCS